MTPKRALKDHFKNSEQPEVFEFRVVAGSLKGKAFRMPNLGVTRPPLTRLRKAIFDFLNPYLVDGSYLDLFSGTGSYLFEAVSRGAQRALGVEMEPMLADAINGQAEKCGIGGQLRCLNQNVFEALPQLAEQGKLFDIVMLAPPQYKQLVDRTLVSLRDNRVVRPGGLIICQHDTSESRKINFLDFEIVQTRKYGNTTFTVVTGRQ